MIDILIDSDNRVIDHLRLSVTEKCNLHCRYCAPETSTIQHELSVAEIERIAKLLFDTGVRSVRITGGEPLMRSDIVEIVASVYKIGFDDVSLTTNATLLTTYVNAQELLKAGLNRINIGISSLNPARYNYITKYNLPAALTGIKIATEKFSDVRINVVMIDGFDNHEFEAFRDYSNLQGVTLRFIEYMPAFGAATATRFDLWKRLEELGANKIAPLFGQGPAEYYSGPGFTTPVGLISPIHKKFCSSCRRIRLSSVGELRRCLFDSHLLDLHSIMNVQTPLEIVQSIKAFIKGKPREHNINKDTKLGYSMAKIGG